MGAQREPVSHRLKSPLRALLMHSWVCSRAVEPQLARFKGRPGELSPKARLWLFAGWLLPSRFK